jgi:hypothetical protein
VNVSLPVHRLGLFVFRVFARDCVLPPVVAQKIQPVLNAGYVKNNVIPSAVADFSAIMVNAKNWKMLMEMDSYRMSIVTTTTKACIREQQRSAMARTITATD